jgi:hypothetical protein
LAWPKGFNIICKLRLDLWTEIGFHSLAEPVSAAAAAAAAAAGMAEGVCSEYRLEQSEAGY